MFDCDIRGCLRGSFEEVAEEKNFNDTVVTFINLNLNLQEQETLYLLDFRIVKKDIFQLMEITSPITHLLIID